MTSRTAHRISLAAGVAILLLIAFGRMLEPVPVCGVLAPNYDPIIAFEMARSVEDLYAIFGVGANACRDAIAAQMNLINMIDCVIYIPLYGAFLIFFLIGLRSIDSQLASRAALVVIVACAADYVENICLFRLSANLNDASALTWLAWSTEVKWVGLGLAGAIGGHLLAKRDGRWRLATVPSSLGLVAALLSIPMPGVAGPYLSLSFLFAWLLFLIVDARESIRGSEILPIRI
jgi:hypothetical protein